MLGGSVAVMSGFVGVPRVGEGGGALRPLSRTQNARSPLSHSPPAAVRAPNEVSIGESQPIAPATPPSQLSMIAATVRRPHDNRPLIRPAGGLFPGSADAADRIRHLADAVMRAATTPAPATVPQQPPRVKHLIDSNNFAINPPMLPVPADSSLSSAAANPVAASAAIAPIAIAASPSGALRPTDVSLAATNPVVAPLAIVPTTIASPAAVVPTTTAAVLPSAAAPAADVTLILQGLLTRMDQISSSLAALSLSVPRSSASRSSDLRRRLSSARSPFSLWLRRELDAAKANVAKFRHQMSVRRSALKRLNVLNKELALSVRQATNATEQQKLNKRHLSAMNDLLVEKGLFRSCESSHDQAVARVHYLRSLTIDDIHSLSNDDALSYQRVVESIPADDPIDLYDDDDPNIAGSDQADTDPSLNGLVDDVHLDSSSPNPSIGPIVSSDHASSTADRTDVPHSSVSATSSSGPPLSDSEAPTMENSNPMVSDDPLVSDVDSREMSATSAASSDVSDSDEPVVITKSSTSTSFIAPKGRTAKKVISFVDDEAREAKTSTRSTRSSSTIKSSSSSSTSASASGRSSSQSRSSFSKHEAATDERITFKRVPRDLVKLLDRLDTKYYYGSTDGDASPPKNALHDVFKRFEAYVGQSIMSAYSDVNDGLRPIQVFRKYAANPLVAPLIFNAFGRHLKVPLVFDIWNDHPSYLWEVRKQALFSQVLPDRTVVLSKVQSFSWNGSETVEALRQRASTLALEKLDTDPSFVNAGDQARDHERERIFRELMVEAFKAYPTAYAALQSWAASRPSDEDFDTRALVYQIRGQIRGLLTTPAAAAASVQGAAVPARPPKPPNASSTTISSAPTATSAPDKRAERDAMRRTRIQSAVISVLSGDLPIEQVRDREVLAILEKSATKGFFNKDRLCYACRDYVGIVPGVTADAPKTHTALNCPFRTAIATVLDRLRQQSSGASIAPAFSPLVSSSAVNPVAKP